MSVHIDFAKQSFDWLGPVSNLIAALIGGTLSFFGVLWAEWRRDKKEDLCRKELIANKLENLKVRALLATRPTHCVSLAKDLEEFFNTYPHLRFHHESQTLFEEVLMNLSHPAEIESFRERDFQYMHALKRCVIPLRCDAPDPRIRPMIDFRQRAADLYTTPTNNKVRTLAHFVGDNPSLLDNQAVAKFHKTQLVRFSSLEPSDDHWTHTEKKNGLNAFFLVDLSSLLRTLGANEK